jgi:hypothetical protein
MNFDRVFDQACELINIYDGPNVFLQTFRSADPNAGIVYAAYFCQWEVCNGGFRQFFSNSTGVLAPEAVEAFARLGMPNTADLVRRACERVDTPYPRERSVRNTTLKELDFRDLEDRFYDLVDQENGGFEAASQQFIDELSG